MKVSKLIKILQGLPKNLDVYLASHDHGDFETDSKAGTCHVVEMGDASEDQIDFCNKDMPKEYVVIRP